MGVLLTLLALTPVVVIGQEAGEAPPERGFEPEFIDAGSYRHEGVLLHDWPELTELVRASGPVAEAVARDDGTLTAELLQEFRDRVGELSEDPAPAFLAARSDSVRAILQRIEARLLDADSLLVRALPAVVADPTGEERPNESDRERTYATGPTAVRVPAGIDVGDSDSLPGARIEGSAGKLTFIDLVAESLAELDGLVHLVRKIGAPATPGP
ncbi:hypothetical protein BH20GEM1_BH20GEM1_20390 [soil metagenome]